MLKHLLGTNTIRQIVDHGFRRYAHIRTCDTDSHPLGESQEQTLLRLVQTARNTQFGIDHRFRSIRSVEDFQDRVPLREYESFWSEYWQNGLFRGETGSWPGRIRYLALSSGTTSGTTKYVPVNKQVLSSNKRAALTAVAWYRTHRPSAQLFTGPMFFLGGSTDLRPFAARDQHSRSPLVGDLSGIVAGEVPDLLQPFTFPPRDLALLSDWEDKVWQLAEQSARLPITLVSGVPAWLLVLFDRLRQVTGRSTIAEIWPHLRLIVHGGTKFDPYRALFRETIGSDQVDYLETYPASEGFVAAEDPRFGLLRLIPDHNIFYEFVPVAELDSIAPTRHTVSEVVPGVQYAVVLTTCAGLWSYLLGDTVCFASCEPPLLRFTGRIKQFLSAFGEHLIGEEIERAVSQAASDSAATVRDFHVGPVFPQGNRQVGCHRYFVEFARPPEDLHAFLTRLDSMLQSANDDYRAHRYAELTIAFPELTLVPPGGFANWMRARGKLGGQHKVPRVDNSGTLTAELGRWFTEEAAHGLSQAR